MEKTAVIYSNKYGSTEKYAKWIAEVLDCPAIDMKDIKKQDIAPYDNIIYGGGVHAGGIRGWDTFRKWLKPYLTEDFYASFEDELVYVPTKKVVVFAVGVNVQIFDTRAQLRDINFDKRWLKPLTCYYLDGAYDPSKVVGVDKMVMGLTMRMLRNKGLNMNKDERVLFDRVENGCDLVDRKQIKYIVQEFIPDWEPEDAAVETNETATVEPSSEA